MLILSYIAESTISEKELENLSESRIVEDTELNPKENLNIDKEIKVEIFYEDYLQFNFEKTLLKIFFFFSLICIVSTNISISNTINLSIFLLFIVLSLLQPLKNNSIGILSQVFVFFSFVLLVSQYFMNLNFIKNKKINSYVGIVEFEKRLGMLHFISLSIGFLIACTLNKYDYDLNEYKEKCRVFMRNNSLNFKSLKEVFI